MWSLDNRFDPFGGRSVQDGSTRFLRRTGLDRPAARDLDRCRRETRVRPTSNPALDVIGLPHTTAAACVLDPTAAVGPIPEDNRARMSTAELISGSERVKGMR